jgi:hypothetical protein
MAYDREQNPRYRRQIRSRDPDDDQYALTQSEIRKRDFRSSAAPPHCAILRNESCADDSAGLIEREQPLVLADLARLPLDGLPVRWPLWSAPTSKQRRFVSVGPVADRLAAILARPARVGL